jgi:hypothetical protein
MGFMFEEDVSEEEMAEARRMRDEYLFRGDQRASWWLDFAETHCPSLFERYRIRGGV